MWSNERFSSIRTTTWLIAARLPLPVPFPLPFPVPADIGALPIQLSPAGRRSRADPLTTLPGVPLARGGFVRGGPGRLRDLLVRVVTAEGVEHVLGVRVGAARDRVEQRHLLADGNRLTEADRQVVRVRGLVVTGQGPQGGRAPGEVVGVELKLRRHVARPADVVDARQR